MSNDNLQFIVDINGNKIPNATLIKDNCPLNCSGHGLCNDNAICVCETGYSQVDCSVKISNPPKIIGLSIQKNFIDSSNGNPKDLIVSLSRFVSENVNSSINVSILVSCLIYKKKINKIFNKLSIKIRTGNRNFGLENSLNIKGQFLNLQSTFLDINSLTKNATKEWYILQLAATNDGSSYSTPVKLMVYPTKTYTCNMDIENFSCNKV